jgi:tetratricopeptide (TPR) repeat protein
LFIRLVYELKKCLFHFFDSLIKFKSCGITFFSIIAVQISYEKHFLQISLNTIKSIADNHVNDKNFKDALVLYKQCLRMEKNHKISMAIGLVCFKLGKFKKCFHFFEKACLMSEPSNFSAIADILSNLGLICYEIALFDTAIDFYKKSLGVYRKVYSSDNNSTVGIIIINIANSFFCLSQYEQTIEYFERALLIFWNLYYQKKDQTIAELLINIGVIYSNVGVFESAICYLEQALDIYKAMVPKNNEMISSLLNNIGEEYRKKGTYLKALENYHESLKIKLKLYENVASQVIANTLNNIGLIYIELGKYRDALEYFEDSLSINKMLYEDLKSWSIVRILNNIAHVYYKSFNYEKALESGERALDICQKLLEDDFNQPMIHQEIAMIFYSKGVMFTEMGNVEKGLFFLFKTYFILRKVFKEKENLVMANCLHTIAEAKTFLRSFEEAVDFYEKSLAIRMNHDLIKIVHDYDLNEFNLLHEKAIQLKMTNNYKESIKFYRKLFNLTRG